MNMEFRRKLPIPKEIKAMYPISPEFERLREQKDKEVKDILSGQDDRLLLLGLVPRTTKPLCWTI